VRKRLDVNERLLLKVEDAAALIDVSRSTFYQLINAGRVPVVRIGRSVRVPRAWLEKWISEQTGT